MNAVSLIEHRAGAEDSVDQIRLLLIGIIHRQEISLHRPHERVVLRTGTLANELLGETTPDPVIDGARFARNARGAAAFLDAAITLALERTERGHATPNQFFEVAGHGIHGTPDAGYAACWY